MNPEGSLYEEYDQFVQYFWDYARTRYKSDPKRVISYDIESEMVRAFRSGKNPYDFADELARQGRI